MENNEGLKKYTYLEILKYDSEECVKRIDVSGKTERQIEKIENGMLRNMNIQEHYTEEVSSETELDII